MVADLADLTGIRSLQTRDADAASPREETEAPPGAGLPGSGLVVRVDATTRAGPE
jgi:hypothetical protein